MKRVLSLILIMALGLALLTGCGRLEGGAEEEASQPGTIPTQTVDLEEIKTIGEAREIEADETQYGYMDKTYVYAFAVNDNYYRVLAPIPDDVAAKFDKLDVTDEGYEEAEAKLASPLIIDKREELNDRRLSPEELNTLIGKTGEELQNDGWVNTGYNIDMMEFYFQRDLFQYTITFEGDIEYTDDFDEVEACKPLIVKSAQLEGFGDVIQVGE